MTLGRNTNFKYMVTPQSSGQQRMQGELIARVCGSLALSAEVVNNRKAVFNVRFI